MGGLMPLGNSQATCLLSARAWLWEHAKDVNQSLLSRATCIIISVTQELQLVLLPGSVKISDKKGVVITVCNQAVESIRDRRHGAHLRLRSVLLQRPLPPLNQGCKGGILLGTDVCHTDIGILSQLIFVVIGQVSICSDTISAARWKKCAGIPVSNKCLYSSRAKDPHTRVINHFNLNIRIEFSDQGQCCMYCKAARTISCKHDLIGAG
jgi:hypothetical protein